MNIFRVYELCAAGLAEAPGVRDFIEVRNRRILAESAAREAAREAEEKVERERRMSVMKSAMGRLVRVRDLGDIHPPQGWQLFQAGPVYVWKGHGRAVVTYGGIYPPDRL